MAKNWDVVGIKKLKTVDKIGLSLFQVIISNGKERKTAYEVTSDEHGSYSRSTLKQALKKFNELKKR